MLKYVAFSFAALTASAALAQEGGVDISIYPAAKAGYQQHVFTLPALENEYDSKIEVYVTQKMSVDCNRVMIGADLESEDIKGWGYSYYVVEDIKPPAQTLMGCPDDKKTEELVPLHFGDDAFVRYNSKLPLVVYAPEGLNVGYRLWQTDGTVIDK